MNENLFDQNDSETEFTPRTDPSIQLSEPDFTETTMNKSPQKPSDFTQAELSKKVQGEISKKILFGDQSFLLDPSKQTSTQFLDEITYNVDLSKIYLILDTCYWNNNISYCPILVRKTLPALNEPDTLLLQVWNSAGAMVYQREIMEPPQAWFVSYDALIFIPGKGDRDADCVFIVYLKKKNTSIKVGLGEEMVGMIEKMEFKLGFCNQCVFIAVDDKIHVMNCKYEERLTEGGVGVLNDFVSGARSAYLITLNMKVHAFLLPSLRKQQQNFLYAAVEVHDHQIDFQKVVYFPDKTSHRLKQIQEVLPRQGLKQPYDPIKDFKSILIGEAHYAVALRESGFVDFYWNYFRISCSEDYDKTVKYDKIELTFEGIYVREQLSQEVKEIKVKWEGRVGIEVGEKGKILQVLDFEKLFQQRIKDYVPFYHTYCLINTSFIVAHNNKIFIYDILNEEWVKSFSCKTPVLKVFRNIGSQNEIEVGIMLKNSRFTLLVNRDTQGFNPLMWEMVGVSNYRVEGSPFQVVNDAQHFNMLFILTKKENGDCDLIGFAQQRLHLLKADAMLQIGANTQIIPVFSGENESKFLLYNKRVSEGMGEMQMVRYKLVDAVSKEGKKIQKVKLMFDKEQSVYSFEDRVFYAPEEGESNGEDIIHSAIADPSKLTVALFTSKNIYVVNLRMGTVFTVSNANICSLQMIDTDFCYAIQNPKSSDKMCSFSLICIYKLLQNNEFFEYNIQSVMGGINNLLDFSIENQRLAFLQSYDRIKIIPPLHRVTINFMGMLDRDKYLSAKKIGNKFMALDKQGRMTVWNVATGKLVMQNSIPEALYRDYEIFANDEDDCTFKREWSQFRSLIYDTKAQQQEQMCFDISKCDLKQSISYLRSLKAQVHQFKYIEIENENKVTEHLSFSFRISSKYQKIFISDDLKYMIERLYNYKVQIYERDPSLTQGWKPVQRIQNFPHDLADMSKLISNCLFLFSPNLLRYLNFDMNRKKFYIINTISRDRGVNYEVSDYTYIPDYLMDVSKENAETIAQRFKWVTNDTFLIANKHKFEKLIKIQEKEDKSFEFIELSQASIAAFNYDLEAPDTHLYVDFQSLACKDVEQRLLRKHQALNRALYVLSQKEEQGFPSSQSKQSSDKTLLIYNVLLGVDMNMAGCKGKFVADLSFSYVHWNLIEQLESKALRSRDIDINSLKYLTLNILPGAQTIFHLLAPLSQEIAFICKQFPLDSPKLGFVMPFIPNIDGKTALHVCLEDQNYQSVDILLNYLSKAPVDHHSRSINDIIPKFLSQNLPSVPLYLESRLRTTPQIEVITRGAIKPYSDEMDDGVALCHFWTDMKEARRALFDGLRPDGTLPNEYEIRLKFLDLPEYHCYAEPNCEEFFRQLKETSQTELFQLKSVRTLIDFLWPLAKSYTLRRLFFPFLCFLITFWAYTNIVSPLDTRNFSNYVVTVIFQNILILFSIYFIQNEVSQILVQKANYFSSPWNYIDLIPPFLIIISAGFDLIIPEMDYWWEFTFQAICSLLMWIKLLYFFRIHKSTGYLIRMIVKVIYGMRIFLLVVLITIVAFADAFISLQSRPSPGEEHQNPFAKFVDSCFFTYRTIIGDIDLSVFSPEHELASSILFFLCTLFVMVVMLNLLIAIISQTFDEVQQNQVNEFYQEKASIISENSYLIPKQVKRAFCSSTKYLLLASKVESQQELINRIMFEGGQGDEGKGELITQTLVKQLGEASRKRMDMLEKKIDTLTTMVQESMFDKQKSIMIKPNLTNTKL